MGGMLCTRRRNLPLDQSSPFSPSKTQRRFYAPEHQELPREVESGAMVERDEFRRKKGKGVTRGNGLAPEERAWDAEHGTPTSQATPKSILADHCEDRFGSRRSRPDNKASRFIEEHPLASPPRKLRWKKGELIGAGAFGRVYMGMNVESGELIAVKQVLVAKNNPDKQKAQEQIRELEEEVALLKNLSHENIVRYIGTDREEEALNIFLEFVPGGSIASLLGKFGAFSERVVRVYTRQLLLGLKYLHDHHIMHRDIKGANILVDNKGCIKLADFGASKKLQDLATVAEGYKTMKGTPYWMAPEVIKGTGHGRPADIWSVGCTVIEMATGKAPWSQFQNPVAAIYHIASAQTGPPIPDSLSPEGQDFLRKCLQRDQKLRPAVGVLLQHPFLANPMPQSIRGTVGNSFVQSVSPHQVSVQRGSEVKSTWESNNLTDPMDDSCLPRGYLSTATTGNFGTMPEFGAQGWDENGLMSTGAAFNGAQSTLQASNQYNGKPPLRSTSGAVLEPSRFGHQSKASPSGDYLEERRAGEQVGTSGRGVLNTMNGNSQRQWGLRSPVGEVGNGPWPSDAGMSLRSYNPMQEPSYMGPGGISWLQAARGNVVAEPSNMVVGSHNPQHGTTVHHHIGTVDEGEYHGSRSFDKPFSGTLAGHNGVSGLDAEEEEEVTEVSIIRYLNTKALELSRLQTPLLEEFQLQGEGGSPFSLSSHNPPNPQEHYPESAHHKWQVPELSDSQRHHAAPSPRTAGVGSAGTVLGGSRESEASIGTEKKRSGHLLSAVPTPNFPGAADASGYQDSPADNTRASTREQQWQRELQLELARQRGRTNM